MEIFRLDFIAFKSSKKATLKILNDNGIFWVNLTGEQLKKLSEAITKKKTMEIRIK